MTDNPYQQLEAELDAILTTMEEKYFSAEYDDQASEAIRWPAKAAILALMQKQRAEWERVARISEITMLDNSGLFDTSDIFHNYYISRIAELQANPKGGISHD